MDFEKKTKYASSSIFFSPVEGADDTNSAILTNCHTFRIILVITLSSKYTNCTKCDAGVGSIACYYRDTCIAGPLSRYYRALPQRYRDTIVTYLCS